MSELSEVLVVRARNSMVYTYRSNRREPMREDLRREFETFVRDVEPSLRRGLVSAYGFERGRDATAEALGWAWQHWDRTRGLDNKVAYLFRIGQTVAKHSRTLARFADLSPNVAQLQSGRLRRLYERLKGICQNLISISRRVLVTKCRVRRSMTGAMHEFRGRGARCRGQRESGVAQVMEMQIRATH
jgi:hypothetical protein